ncbi:hypothetical protein CBR_g29865 [Chara braunii]|uniref:Phosphatidylinositol-3,4,5-trisphosphate 3-phosphatase n=1 Tax=Chara braunii TaxID=69332 RepID=A0A388JWW4_CHABU|nr:hypothetical protein CBR_g29865 [Chara braunii]|eukprot:GBG62257.1 hypothetical protein CBR_g29865 [Chara braunii]
MLPTVYLRKWVSKKRKRFIANGFDLDLSYISERIIAMGYPAEHMMDVMYRNPMWQVQKLLETRHRNHYKVYNLCSELSYDASNFGGRVEVLPFDDYHAPPLSLVKLFCESVSEWLDSDPENVVVVHCKAGKGRTGLMVCSYLVYLGMTAEEALRHYATRRMHNGEGISIASQRRYVGYFSQILSSPRNGCALPEVKVPEKVTRNLRRVRLYDTLNADRIDFMVAQLEECDGQVYSPALKIGQGTCMALAKGQHFQRTVSPRYYFSDVYDDDGDYDQDCDESWRVKGPRVVVQMDTEKDVHKKTYLDHYFETPLPVRGDIRLTFFDKNGGRLFYTCFNTAFLGNGILQLSRSELDKLGRRAKAICGPSFCVELLFGPQRNTMLRHDDCSP